MALAVTALVFAAAASGCGGSAVPSKESAPIKVSEGVDKKGKKTKMVEAAFVE
jgi:hypothetical protein